MNLAIVPIVVALHVSNPTAGPQSEVTQNYSGAGLELRIGNHINVEATVGARTIDCKVWENCGTAAGATLEFKWSGNPLWTNQ